MYDLQESLFSKMCLIIGHAWGIQTILRANLLPSNRWETQNKLKANVSSYLTHNAYLGLLYLFGFVFICFAVNCFLLLPQSFFLNIVWLIPVS